jgi:transforming growth factor-beta-induced protein
MKIFVVITVLLSIVWMSQADHQKTVFQYLESKPTFSTLVALVKRVGLVPLLNSTISNPVTIFAPDNAGFQALPKEIVDKIFNDTQALKDLLLYHTAVGLYRTQNFKDNDLIPSADSENDKIRIDIYGALILAEGARIMKGDITAINGIVHILENVMLPSSGNIPAVLENLKLPDANFTYFKKGMKLVNLINIVNTTGPFTLFVATDEAFSKLPAGELAALFRNIPRLLTVMTYHMVSNVYYTPGLTNSTIKTLEGQTVDIVCTSDGVTVNGFNIIHSDISANNGVIHIIDGVLMPS